MDNKKWEGIIYEKNRELAEMQEAYKEKQRKCQAWEKVLI